MKQIKKFKMEDKSMFREFREVERNIERERREKEERERREQLNRLTGGRHYTAEEVEEAKAFVNSLFANMTNEEN